MEASAIRPSPCAKCKGSGMLFQASGEFAHAVLCECQAAPCAKCDGSGRLYQEKDGYRFLSACTCRRVHKSIALHNAASLPAVFSGRDFDAIKPHFAELESALEAAHQYCNLFVPGKTSQGLLISGPVGTGKTHLLVSVLRYLAVEAQVACRYVEISFLYSEIRKGFSQNRGSLEIIAPLSEVAVLAIDELGKGKMSPFEQETIDELISRRYNAGRPTLFATNYPVTERRERPAYVSTADRVNETRTDQSIRERVGERVFSRLHQMCKFIEFPSSAMDYRRLTHSG